MTPAVSPSSVWPEEFETTPGSMPGPRAVVAEEDACLRHLIACLLAAEGLFVTEVSDANALVQAVTATCADATEPFNLIVADLPMSGHRGFVALERMREAGCHGSAIVISGSLNDSGSEQLERLDAEYLEKPFEIAKLRALASRIRTAYDQAWSPSICPL